MVVEMLVFGTNVDVVFVAIGTAKRNKIFRQLKRRK